MFTRIRNMHPVTGIVIGVVATLVLSGTAMAVTDANFTYSTVKTGWLAIDAADLAPANNDSAASFSGDLAGSLTTSSGGCYATGVNVPQNARLTTVVTYYRNVSAASHYVLDRNHQSSPGSDTIAFQTITDTDNESRSMTYTIPSHFRTVWNNVYSYAYGICMGAGDSFEGARITYTYTSAGD